MTMLYSKTNTEVKKILKSRLNTQRRMFCFDDSHILVLPFIEHKDIDASVEEIKFFIDDRMEFVTLKQIDYLTYKDRNIVLKLLTGESHYLHHRKLDNSFVKAEFNRFAFDKLTIDHIPSIYIVLYSHYLAKTETFNLLSGFSKTISPLDNKVIKEKGFREMVKNKMNSLQPPDKTALLNAYAEIFRDIVLEITISDNNSANLAVESLEYYKNFKSNKISGCL